MTYREQEALQKQRRAAVNSLLRTLGLRAFVVTAWDNIRYLTGCEPYVTVDWYTDTGAAIFPESGQPAIIGGLQGKMREGVAVLGEWSSLPYMPSPLVPRIWGKAIESALQQVGIRSGKIGIDYLPMTILQDMRSRLPSVEFTPVLYDLLRIRAIKSKYEIELIRKVASIVDKGMQAGLDSLRLGITEREVFSEIVTAMFKAGSEMLPWTPCCTCGGEFANLKPTDYRLKEGDGIRWDVGAMFKGYVGDASRTGILGKADDKFKKLYAAVYESHTNGIRAARPGNKGSDVDFAVRSTLQKKGYPTYGIPMGHGLGMRVYELPWVGPREEAGEVDLELKPGMVISLEPESHVNNKFARLEDMILVTETGSEVLTRTGYLEQML